MNPVLNDKFKIWKKFKLRLNFQCLIGIIKADFKVEVEFDMFMLIVAMILVVFLDSKVETFNSLITIFIELIFTSMLLSINSNKIAN